MAKDKIAAKLQDYKLFINGQWVEARSGETFTSDNPADPEELLGRFQKAGPDDVNAAVDAAEDAWEAWADTPAPERGEILFRAASILKQRKFELGKLVTREMGKVLVEGLADVQEAIDIAQYLGGEGRRLFGHTTTSELRDKAAFTLRRPVGVVGLITPWNFPIAIPAWKICAALVSGCSVVFKPSSDTPLCATEFVKILDEAGVPKGVLNLVTGPGETAGMSLVRHPKVRGVSFTGHRDTGAQILREAGVKRIGLELGSKNGIIVMDDADLNLATDGIIWGGFGTTGQRCSAASRVVVSEKVQKELEKRVVARAQKLRIGPGLDAKTEMGPLVNQRALQKVHAYTEKGKSEGARLLTGGKRVARKGWFYEPTVFTNVGTSMKIAQEEIFGPTLSIVPVGGLDEAIEAINSVEYGLTSAIYTSSIRSAWRAVQKIGAGLTYVNASTIGSEAHLPFGGVKKSGNGAREGGIHGIDEFTEVKTVYFDYSGRLQRAQIEPYLEEKR